MKGFGGAIQVLIEFRYDNGACGFEVGRPVL